MKKILIILSIMLLFMLAGCTKRDSDYKSDLNIEFDEDNITYLNESTLYKEPLLIKVGNCEGYSYDSIDLCLYEQSDCDNIHSLDLKDKCYYDNHNCTLILNSSLKDHCLYDAKMRSCEDQEFPPLCRAMVSNNMSYCGSNLECKIRFAYNSGDIDHCYDINDTLMRVSCKAVVNGNHNLCYSGLNSSVSKRKCIIEYSKITSRGGELCSGLKNEYDLDLCLYGVAIYSKNAKLCTKIGALQTWRKCILEIADITKDPTVCDYSYSDDTKDYCLRLLAKKTYTPSYCEDIKDIGDKWRCFGDSIVRDKITKEKCDMISDRYQDWKKECYSNI